MSIKRIIDGKEEWWEEPIEAAGLYYRVPYLVIPRVLVTNMPYEWQEKWVALAQELQDAWNWDEIVNDYTVLPKRGGKFTRDELRDYRHFSPERIDELRSPEALSSESGLEVQQEPLPKSTNRNQE